MIKNGTMIKLLAAAMVFLAAPALFADGIFLKDGSIKEGAIDKKTEDAVTIITLDDLKLEIPMRKVLRIVAGAEYKKIFNITEKSGKEHKGYIVFESPEFYLFREKLTSKKEVKFYKYDVSMIQDKDGTFRRDTANKKFTGYSPSTAAWVSLVPFYSGSFMAGKKPIPGFAFAITKSAAFLGPLLYPLIGSAGSLSAGNSNSSDSTITEKYFKNRTWQIYAGVSFGVWALLTVGDIFYSYNYIKGINKNYANQDEYSQPVAWAVLPKVFIKDDASLGETGTIEGMEIMCMKRF